MSREVPAILSRTITCTTRHRGHPQHIRKHRIPEGTLVRASKPLCRAEYASCIPFGCVFEVRHDSFRRFRADEPWYKIVGNMYLPPYIVPESALKVAKQANKKRAAYANRRG